MPSRTKALVRLLALLSVVLLFGAACGDDEPTTTGSTTTQADGGGGGESVDGTLKFGSVLPKTGDLAQYGPGMEAGLALAIEDINAAGGVLGKDVTLADADEGDSEEVAGNATDRLITSNNVDAIIGAAGSTRTLKGVLPKITQAGRVECSPSNSSPALTTVDDDGLYFRTAPSDKFQSQLLAEKISGDGFTSAAVINRADDYGQAFADLTAQRLQDAGLDVPLELPIDPEGGNFDSEAQQVADAAPEAIAIIAFPEEGAQLFDALIKAGVGPADVPTYVTDGLASDALAKSIDPTNLNVIDGVKGTRPGAGADTSAFDARLKDDKGIDTVTFAAGTYDCAVLIALGAVAAETDDPVKIAAGLVEVASGGTKCSDFKTCSDLLADGEDIDYDGLTGFDLDDAGEPSEGAYEYYEYKDGGKLTVLESTVVTSEEE